MAAPVTPEAAAAAGAMAPEYPPRPNLRIRTPRPDDDELDMEQGGQEPCFSFYKNGSDFSISTAYEFNAQRRRKLGRICGVSVVAPCLLLFILTQSENHPHLMWLLVAILPCLGYYFAMFFNL